MTYHQLSWFYIKHRGHPFSHLIDGFGGCYTNGYPPYASFYLVLSTGKTLQACTKLQIEKRSATTSIMACPIINSPLLLLVLLQSLVRLSILAQSITTLVGGALRCRTTAAAITGSTTSLATGLSSFMGVDFALGELTGADTLIRLAVLAETVMF